MGRGGLTYPAPTRREPRAAVERQPPERTIRLHATALTNGSTRNARLDSFSTQRSVVWSWATDQTGATRLNLVTGLPCAIHARRPGCIRLWKLHCRPMTTWSESAELEQTARGDLAQRGAEQNEQQRGHDKRP